MPTAPERHPFDAAAVEAKAEEPSAPRAGAAVARNQADEANDTREQNVAREQSDVTAHARVDQRVEAARRRLERDARAQLEQQRRAIVRDMLAVYDDLERTLSASEAERAMTDSRPDEDADAALLQGVQLVRDSFLDKLARHGAIPFDSDGQRFDPHQHEAIGTVAVAPSQAGTIVRTLQRGFMMAGEVLRPARVMVDKS